MAGSLTIPNTFAARTGNVSTELIDDNFDVIADYVNAREIAVGVLGSRPAAGVSGRFYFSSDTVTLFVDTGSVWVAVVTPEQTGVVKMTAAASAPSGYLLCDGAAVSRSTYADLFSVISTTYGVGDGANTFNVPNIKGKVVVGLDGAQTEFDARGETGGAKTHTLSTAEMPSHSHTINDPGHVHNAGKSQGTLTAGSGVDLMAASGPVAQWDTAVGFTGISVNAAGSGGAHNNLQPYIVMNYIIKT